MSTLVERVIEDLESFPLDLCERYLYEAIRHVERNCYIECPEHDTEESRLRCNNPARHDGARMARLLNAIPELVNEIARLKKLLDAK
jgi:hypothetical protein